LDVCWGSAEGSWLHFVCQWIKNLVPTNCPVLIAALAFWTPERVKAAVPLDLQVDIAALGIGDTNPLISVPEANWTYDRAVLKAARRILFFNGSKTWFRKCPVLIAALAFWTPECVKGAVSIDLQVDVAAPGMATGIH
jgi:hypothetical protein